MEIQRSGTQPSSTGPDEWFTGTVRIDPLFQPSEPARTGAASVTFEPGARTAWHAHPLGQTLIVTAGCGQVQRWGVRLRRFAQEMWSRSHRAKNIGMGLLLLPPCPTSPFRNISMAEQLIGWNTSAMSSIWLDQNLNKESELCKP